MKYELILINFLRLNLSKVFVQIRDVNKKKKIILFANVKLVKL